MEFEAPKKEEKPKLNVVANLFLAGLAAILPIAATVWVLKIIYIGIAGPVAGPLSKIVGGFFPKAVINLVSFALTFAFILLVGFFAKNIIGKTILKFIDSWFKKVPVVGNIYTGTKQIIDAFAIKNRAAFKRVVLVEYPRKGLYALAFLTKEEVKGIETKSGKNIGENMVNAFVPTTPNPTSGYFIMIPEKDIIPLNISIEDAIKLLVSAGVLTPRS